jgi:GTP-binding protein
LKPTLVIVGRPNVGKSTLFNRLTRSRAAIVADVPGLTRDRHYGHGRLGNKPFIVVDTGGFEPAASEGVVAKMAQQTELALDEADAVMFVLDARAGLMPQDRAIAERLRRLGRPVTLVVNKAEGLEHSTATSEFHALGLGTPYAISAAHGENVSDLIDEVLAPFPEVPDSAMDDAAAEAEAGAEGRIRIAVVGRPNAGKSTLVNRWLGEERMIALDEPGTTRDAVAADFEQGGRAYELVDTAGVRKRARATAETVEKFSVVKTLQAIEAAHVVVLVLDAETGVSEQDAHLAGYILEAGRAMVVAINKWDSLDATMRELTRQAVARALIFAEFAPVHTISAKTGAGVLPLLAAVNRAYAAAHAKLSTPKLCRALIDAVTRQQPPRAGVIRPKLRYAHQGGVNPPRIVVHGNALDRVPNSYWRYLERCFRKVFKLEGTPLRIEYRKGRNPYGR